VQSTSSSSGTIRTDENFLSLQVQVPLEPREVLKFSIPSSSGTIRTDENILRIFSIPTIDVKMYDTVITCLKSMLELYLLLTAGHSKLVFAGLCKAILKPFSSGNGACICDSFNLSNRRLNSGFKDSSSSNTSRDLYKGKN